ncbi:MAG: biotin/lipoyl-binding protein [Chloroflexi bacterium OHK40]
MRRIMILALIVVLAAAGTFAVLGGQSRSVARPETPTVPVQAAAAGVVADGTVLPLADAALSFERSGTVAAILVDEGDAVTEGQPLARLDTRALELRVEQARVGLARAEAQYNQIAAGAAPEVVAVAEAGVAQARANQAQAEASVTATDLAAAQAELANARAALAAVLNGPKTTEVTQAQAAVEQARANLARQRDSLSAAKTNAGLALEQAANTLRTAQDEYSRIYWDNRELEKRPGDLPQARIDQEAAALRTAENAERAMAQAQVSYEQARQAEAEGVRDAEARLRDAEARLEQLLAPPDADRVAAAQARVAAAEANLARLEGPARATQLEGAAAGVAQAQAQLEQAAAGPREVDLAAAQVEIQAARVALRQAELDLEQATLRAPFAGLVARIDLTIGELAGPTTPALVIADMSGWRIETDDLTELEVVRLREGDPVTVRFDALPELRLPGRVRQIKPIGSNRQGDIVYTVVVDLEQSDPRLRWNMTAVVEREG